MTLDRLVMQENDIKFLAIEMNRLDVSIETKRGVYQTYALKFIETLDNPLAYSCAMDKLYFGDR